MSRGAEYLIDPKEVIRVIRQTKGCAAAAIKKLGIGHSCFYEFLRIHPECKKALKDIREHIAEDMLDLAEDTMFWAMAKREENPSEALRAATHVLNKKGHSRGWVGGEKSSSEENLKQEILKINENVLSCYDSMTRLSDEI